MSDQLSNIGSLRLGFVRLWGYAVIVLGCLFIFLGLITLIIQLVSPGSFPELPPLISIFCMLLAGLFVYLGRRMIKANREELKHFIGE
jgi:membrane protein implicated in regulation of membrane protease activity